MQIKATFEIIPIHHYDEQIKFQYFSSPSFGRYYVRKSKGHEHDNDDELKKQQNS